jgi:phosphonate transport system substrate-binding protein
MTRAAAFALLVVVATQPFSGGEKGRTLALIPDGLSPQERIPLQDYLTQQMGGDVRLMMPESYNAAMDGLAGGSIDFACLGALTYVRAHAKIGVVPLVQRTTDLQFHSVFITGANTKIYSLKDLKGKKFAFGDINSASAHLMPYIELRRAGINPETDLEFRYSGGHPLTVKLVEAGVVDAGVTDETVYSSMVSSGKIDGKKIRVFYTTKPYVDYVYVARKGVPEAERDRFVSAMLGLKQGKNDSVLKVLRASKFVKASDEEYASLRQVAHELKMF